MKISCFISMFIEKQTLRCSGAFAEETELKKIDTIYFENSKNINHSVILLRFQKLETEDKIK